MTRAALDIMYDASKQVSRSQHRLESLARAFRRVGNEAVADELEEIAGWLLHASVEMDRGVTEYVNAGLRQSEEATGNMLRAAIAAASVD